MHASVPHGAALAPADCQQGRPASLAVMIPLRSRAPPSCRRRRHPDECRHARVLDRCCSIFRRCALQKECWLVSTPEQTPLLVSVHEKTLLENPIKERLVRDNATLDDAMRHRKRVYGGESKRRLQCRVNFTASVARQRQALCPAQQKTHLTEQSKSICPFPGPSFMIVGAVLLASDNSA